MRTKISVCVIEDPIKPVDCPERDCRSCWRDIRTFGNGEALKKCECNDLVGSEKCFLCVGRNYFFGLARCLIIYFFLQTFFTPERFENFHWKSGLSFSAFPHEKVFFFNISSQFSFSSRFSISIASKEFNSHLTSSLLLFFELHPNKCLEFK